MINLELSSSFLKARISSLGAELVSLHDSEDFERIHQPDGLWNESAPLLFPIVGRMQDSCYLAGGEKHEMEIHGFLRKRDFEVESATSSSAVLSYESSLEEGYPFSFRFTAGYKIVDNRLEISYQVKNKGQRDMYYALGFHPGLRLKKDISSYSLFPSSFTENLMAPSCLSLEERRERALGVLSHDLFDNDALVFVDVPSSYSLLEEGRSYVDFFVEGFDVLTLWHWPKREEDYICIEPCTAIPGYEGRQTRLEERKDYLLLHKGEARRHHVTLVFN